jgi:hypothetical protein
VLRRALVRGVLGGALVSGGLVLVLLAVIVREATRLGPLALAVELGLAVVVALLLVLFSRLALQIRPVLARLLVFFRCSSWINRLILFV